MRSSYHQIEPTGLGGGCEEKIVQNAWWALRTFKNCMLKLCFFLWATYLGHIVDYCGPMYFPYIYQDVDELESMLHM